MPSPNGEHENACRGYVVKATRQSASSDRGDAARLVLLDGFELYQNGRVLHVPMTVQRVLAFLALHDRPVPRSQVAGTLWLDASEERATGSLRSALWRLRQPGEALVKISPSHLQLAPEVTVDYREAVRHARALLDHTRDDVENELLDCNAGCLSRELLPGWWQDWILTERERFRQLRLHALEARCQRLALAGRFAQAVEAGLAAVACEPLRESAHRLLISVHLAEGNRVEAIRQYRMYQRLLHEELALEPSPQVQAVLGELLDRPAVTQRRFRAAAGRPRATAASSN
jgi:DNA-binding SARP family transcriptional activator